MASRTYGILWRWHFAAGLIACPIVLVLALTGALYVFQPELDRWLYDDLLVVEPGAGTGAARRPIDELRVAVPPTCRLDGVAIRADRDRSIGFTCATGDRRETFVDPYRGHVLGHRRWEDSAFGFILELHWELLLGERGRLVIEWGTSWTLLLLLSGAVLWWPRGARRAGGVWTLRRGVAARQRLRDLHAVLGVYAIPVLFAIVATGLFWTKLAGQDRWKRVTADAVTARWEAPHRSIPVPGVPRIGIDAALAGAGIDLAVERRELYVAFPSRAEDPYTIWAWDGAQERPSWQSTIWVDAYTGARLDQVTWHEHDALGAIDTSGYAIHVGSILGLPGRIAALAAALVLAALCITGPWMWWKRRPRGGLGAPPPARRRSWALYAALVGLGWLLPTVGYTLLAAIAIEAMGAAVRWISARARA